MSVAALAIRFWIRRTSGKKKRTSATCHQVKSSQVKPKLAGCTVKSRSQVRSGQSRQGKARHGKARHGKARHGTCSGTIL